MLGTVIKIERKTIEVKGDTHKEIIVPALAQLKRDGYRPDDLLVTAQEETYFLREFANGDRRIAYFVKQDDNGIMSDMLEIFNSDVKKYGEKRETLGSIYGYKAALGLLQGNGIMAGPTNNWLEKLKRAFKRRLMSKEIDRIKRQIAYCERNL